MEGRREYRDDRSAGLRRDDRVHRSPHRVESIDHGEGGGEFPVGGGHVQLDWVSAHGVEGEQRGGGLRGGRPGQRSADHDKPLIEQALFQPGW